MPSIIRGDDNFDTAEAFGGRVLLATLTASASSSLEFTAFDATKYHGYEFVFDEIKTSVDANVRMRTSADGGSTFDSGVSDYSWWYDANGSTFNDITSDAITMHNGQLDTSSNITFCGKAYLSSPDATTNYTQFTGAASSSRAGGSLKNNVFAGCRNSAAVVNGWQVYPDAGTITSGNVYVYGLVK